MFDFAASFGNLISPAFVPILSRLPVSGLRPIDSLALAGSSLAHLAPLDIAVIVIYFAMVMWIGFYLKKRANTSE